MKKEKLPGEEMRSRAHGAGPLVKRGNVNRLFVVVVNNHTG